MIIWLSSYPRSGNTFFRIVANRLFGLKTYSIYNDLFDIESNKRLKEETGHTLLDKDSIDTYRDSDRFYLIKTHDLPDASMKKDYIVYLIRDGRTATSSFSKYLQAYWPESSLTFSELVYGLHSYGSWKNHVGKWGDFNAGNKLTLKFEDLIKDPLKCADQFGRLINTLPKQSSLKDFEQLQEIDPKFFRKGKPDSWKDEVHENDLLYFWMHSYDQMIQHGYGDNIPALMQNEEARKLINLGMNISEHMARKKYSNKEKSKLDLAKEFYRRNEHEEAIFFFRRCLKEATKVNNTVHILSALYYLGLCYKAIGDNSNARRFFNECLAVEPNHKQAAIQLSTIE